MVEKLRTLQDFDGRFETYNNELRDAAKERRDSYKKELLELASVHGYRPILEGKITELNDFFNLDEEER